MGAARHSFEEHTSEVKVHLEAPTLETLFSEAGLALAEVMGAPLGAPPHGERRRVELEARDVDALLVDWLNELLFLTETARQPFTAFRFDSLTEHALTAEVSGPRVLQERTPVKAATHHGLDVIARDDGFEASVVLDV